MSLSIHHDPRHALHPVRVLEIEPGDVAQRLGALLRGAGVPHRMFEERGRIVVVARSRDAELVNMLYQRARAGEGTMPEFAGEPLIPLASLVVSAPATAATVLLIGVVSLAAAIVPIDRWLWLIDPQQIGPTPLRDVLASGQWWRLWTPVLMHGGPLHLLFNLLWVWEFGRRIESALGAARLLPVLLVSGVAGNCAEYAWLHSAAFLGASGMVCGMLGFLLVANRIRPDPRLQLPGALAVAFIVMLLVMSSGVLGVLPGPLQVNVANAAHWGGLGAGALLAWLMVPR